jgi:hypothetical protein
MEIHAFLGGSRAIRSKWSQKSSQESHPWSPPASGDQAELIIPLRVPDDEFRHAVRKHFLYILYHCYPAQCHACL